MDSRRAPRSEQPELPAIPGYRIIRELGRGGFGAVYLAEQERLGGLVAVKAFDPRGMGPESRGDYLNRFRQEARILAKLRGRENIVQVFDLAKDEEGGDYIVMEYVEGESLRHAAPPGTPLRLADAVRVAREAARALAAAHALGVVHRDVKPENIMIAADGGRAKVMDFGIARSDDAPFRTASREAFGTPSYMPPEQLYGAGNVDHRADVYSLAVVLYAISTGRIPFDETNPFALAERIRDDAPPPPSRFRTDLPQELELVILRGMAKRPEDRFQSMEEFEKALASFAESRDLAAIVSGKPLVGDRPNPIARDATEPRRNKMTPASLAPTIPGASTKAANYETIEDSGIGDETEVDNPASRGWRSGPFEPPDASERHGPGEVKWLVGFLAAFGAMALLGIVGLALLSTADGPSSASVKGTPSATPGPESTPRPAPPAPKAGDDETFDLGGGATLKLVFVPPGEFVMGSPPEEEGRNTDEEPATRVTISNGFWMSPTEVTRAQWRAVMKSEPPGSGPNDAPVVDVSWDDAMAYCAALSKHTGREVSLPTEAQWEYACRAGSQGAFSFAETLDLGAAIDHAWFHWGGLEELPEDAPAPPTSAMRVGLKEPNAFGLHDLHGNVWEWCLDGHTPALPGGEVVDWFVESGSGARRAARGGAWGGHPLFMRSGNRYWFSRDHKNNDVGFRVVAPG